MADTKLITKLRIKTNKDNSFDAISTAQETDSTKKLSFGEPLYIASEDYMVIGGADETQTLALNGKVIRLLKKDVADSIGTKWLDGFYFDINAYTKYKINNDGSLSEETTDVAPCGIKIDKFKTGQGNNLAKIKSTMSPTLSLCIPATYRNNTAFCKGAIKNFSTITSSETVNEGVVLFFSRKLPTAGFNINLIGG